ncbi:MAG TPA: phosphoglucosamine mutase, partial [Candidatus Saccharimonadia bacterium]|nr:phosphoglucosamine mutase [Candidatus Saccharimonadia bacterium]
AQAGAAFDGDGDRVMLVDEKGRQLSGDHILYILALTGGHQGVVATLMSNMGLELALKKHGITLHRMAVGDRYVLEGLEKTGLKLGGEQSGHLILPELATTGDGILAAIQTLAKVKDSGRTLAQWYDELELLPQKLVNFPVEDKSSLQRTEVQDYIARESAQLAEVGRLNVRPSGTEPIIRVMVEAPDADSRAKKIADHLSQLINTAEGNAKP